VRCLWVRISFYTFLPYLLYHYGEIRYESSACVADSLSIDVLRNNSVDEELIIFGRKWKDI